MLVGEFTWDSYESYLLTGELFLVENLTFTVERVVETEERPFPFFQLLESLLHAGS